MVENLVGSKVQMMVVVKVGQMVVHSAENWAEKKVDKMAAM